MKNTRFTETMGTLSKRFTAKMDGANALHKDLAGRFSELAKQLNALEALRETSDLLTTARAANRLKFLAEEHGKVIVSKSKEAALAFESALQEHGGLKPGPFAPEIRQRLHAMKPGERITAIQAMVTARDGQSLAAVLDAPGILTGLSPDELSKTREQYYQTACPDLVKARDVHRDLVEHIDAAIKTSLTAATVYGDPRKLRELEEREAVSAKAREALNG